MLNSILKQAQIDLRSGNKQKATSLITTYLKEYPEDERGWLLLSLCQNNLSKKTRCLNKVLQINPKNKTALKALDQLSRQYQKKSYKPIRISSFSTILFGFLFLMMIGLIFITIVPKKAEITASLNQIPPSNQPSQPQPEIFFAAEPILDNESDETNTGDEDAQEITSQFDEAADTISLPDIPAGFCIPKTTHREIGVVISSPSADILNVQVDEEIVTVKYIGIEIPTKEEHGGQKALEANQSLVGQTVVLVQDNLAQDEQGHWLRYVLAGEYFVNYQFLEWGMATPTESAPNSACESFFLVAQNTAQEQKIGLWEIQDVRMDPNDWRNWPIVPLISEKSKEIYRNGIAMGNDPTHFSILGDCQAPQWRLFGRFDWETYILDEEYTYMQATVDTYSGQWSRNSVTVASGNTVATLYSVYWADADRCEANETAIACELRVNNPSVALVMLGTNWPKGNNLEFDNRLRQTVEYLIELGIVPILVNKADATEPDFPLNLIMAQVAYDYDILLSNFWASVQNMPNHGIDPNDEKGIHLLPKAFIPKRTTGLQTLHALLSALAIP